LERGVIDWDLSDEIDQVGGFSTTLSVRDRNRLRAIVRKVHLQHYPGHLIDDLLCDRIIDVIAPETAAYLIRHNLDQGML
jgi:hypothetical protein